jgi:hypothetical protein
MDYSDFDKFFRIFSSLDEGQTGFVKLEEVLQHLQITSTSYMSKMLGQFDENHTGYLDFMQFVLGVWNYCSEHHICLMSFSIKLLLQDAAESLDVDKVELKTLLMEIYCSLKRTRKQISHYEEDLTKLLAPYPSKLSRTDTLSLILFNPVLSLASTALQGHIREQILGLRAWRAIVGVPVSMPDGRKLKPTEFKEKKLYSLLLQQSEERMLQSYAAVHVCEILSPDKSSSLTVMSKSVRSDRRSGAEESENSSSYVPTSRRIFPIQAGLVYPNGDFDCGEIVSHRSTEEEVILFSKTNASESKTSFAPGTGSDGLTVAWAASSKTLNGDDAVSAFVI